MRTAYVASVRVWYPETLLSVTVMENLSEKVLERVAEAEGVDPSELETPLFEVVDPDSLDSIFEPMEKESQRNRGQVQFPYYGYRVVVTAEGNVTLRERD